MKSVVSCVSEVDISGGNSGGGNPGAQRQGPDYFTRIGLAKDSALVVFGE